MPLNSKVNIQAMQSLSSVKILQYKLAEPERNLSNSTKQSSEVTVSLTECECVCVCVMLHCVTMGTAISAAELSKTETLVITQY